MSTLASVVVIDLLVNRPTASIPGRLFFANDTGVLYRDNGSSWDLYSGVVGTGTTGSLGGSAMTAGQRVTTTVGIALSTTAMVATCSPANDPGAGFVWHAYVSAAGTVTVVLTCVSAGTPNAANYNVAVVF